MTTRSLATPQLPPIRARDQRWAVAVVAILAALAGLAIPFNGQGALLGLVGLAVLSSFFALGIANWRWSVYGLLLYLPFAGIPILATYPNSHAATLLKDFLFVLPAYVGFLLASIRSRWVFPAMPLFYSATFALLVVAQVFNPNVENLLVGLIGVKVWLFYIPLLFLGYYLIETRSDLLRILDVMTWVALIPAVIGIVEAILLYGGQSQFVYSLYGPSAEAATQGFVGLNYGGDNRLWRIPSTFSSVFNYFIFTASMVAVAYARWRAAPGQHWGVRLFAVILLASFTSGARAAFIMVPFLIALIVFLEGRARRAVGSLAVIGLGLLVALTILSASAGDLLLHAFEIGLGEFWYGLVRGMPQALDLAPFGLGSGIVTGAARYVSDDYAWGIPVMKQIESESWWVKVVLELGLPGLLIVAGFLGSIVVVAYAAHRHLEDPGLRVI